MYLLYRSANISRASNVMKIPKWIYHGLVTGIEDRVQCYSHTVRNPFHVNSADYFKYSCFAAFPFKNVYQSYRLPRVLPVSISSISRTKFSQSFSTHSENNKPLFVSENPNKLVKDVIIFKYENPRFFKYLNIFAAFQFFFWLYMTQFVYSCLRDISRSIDKKKKSEDKTQSFWIMNHLGTRKFRLGLTALCFAVGYIILSCSWLYTLKAVRYLILHKGGKKVSFVTYAPLGKNRIMSVPLENVSSQHSRLSSSTQLAIKVKGQWLHYVLNLGDGQFPRPTLFDKTVGIKRVFK